LHSKDAGPAKGTLYVVATPVGNLRDLSFRALDVLTAVEKVAAEDTRVTARLLAHYGLSKRLLPLHEHNERRVTHTVLRLLEAGQSVALVSDAGTPAVSDPGAHLVAQARRRGYPVVPVPGANAALCALSAAGLPDGPFLLYGFLPARPKARCEALAALAALPFAIVFYEAPHRIVASLRAIGEILGQARPITLAKELTKVHETFCEGSAEELAAWLEADSSRLRGEFVLIVHGRPPQAQPSIPLDAARLLAALVEELPLSRAAAVVAKLTGGDRQSLYAQARAMKRRGEEG
jgi:16S rRNA (cytidine1402-2'-O)-methyltransferase